MKTRLARYRPLVPYLCPMSHPARRILGYLFLALSLGTGCWMYLQTQQDNLWGYAPLLLYFGLYAGVFLLATYRNDGTTRERNLLSTATGLLLGVGFPGFIPFPLVLLVALVPLYFLARDLRTVRASARSVFLHGFSAFVLYNLLASYWVTNTGFFAGLFAVLVNSALMCLPWLILHWIGKRSPSIAYLAFSTAWVSFEFLHHNWSLNWPWLSLGNGFMQFPELVQWYEITGIFGGTAWILAVNYLVYRAALAHFRPDMAPASAPKYWWLSAAVLLPLLGSLVRYWTYTPPAGETITVAAIQPNLEPHYEKFNGNSAAQIDTFLRLSAAALSDGPVDYLVYPETSFGNIDERKAGRDGGVGVVRQTLAGRGAGYLVTGISAHKFFDPGEPLTEAVRYYDRGANGQLAYEALNGAVQVSASNDDPAFQTYRKGVFVPGPESFPFRDALYFLEPLVESVGGTVAGLGVQENRTPFTTPKAAIAPVICYESVFGEYFTGYIQEGAQAVFVMTNDGWWDNTAGHRQHLWLSSLRAVETRRDVVRSANMGACAFIDQRGKITSRTHYGREGYLRGSLRLNDATTWYVRVGDIIARVALLIFTLVVLVGIVRTVRPRRLPDR